MATNSAAEPENSFHHKEHRRDNVASTEIGHSESSCQQQQIQNGQQQNSMYAFTILFIISIESKFSINIFQSKIVNFYLKNPQLSNCFNFSKFSEKSAIHIVGPDPRRTPDPLRIRLLNWPPIEGQSAKPNCPCIQRSKRNNGGNDATML